MSPLLRNRICMSRICRSAQRLSQRPCPVAFIIIIIIIVHSSIIYALPQTLAALDTTSDLSCRKAPQHHLWNRQRNYMSLWALTQLFDESEHWYSHGLPMPVLDRDPRWDKGFYDFEYEQTLLKEFGAIECPLGWLSAQLLRAPMPSRVRHRGFLKNATDKGFYDFEYEQTLLKEF